MRILIACEFSARVRDQFIAQGHEAFSCDLVQTTGDPKFHLQQDAVELAYSGNWDAMIAFPPCTYLTKSNAWRWDEIAPQRREALKFVNKLLNAPIRYIALENPVGAIGTQIRKADQYVHPWNFGDPYQKRTGFWLKNLPLLAPEITEKPSTVQPWVQAGYGPVTGSATTRSGRLSGGIHRKASERNLTFPGIARAIGLQWGRYISEHMGGEELSRTMPR